METLTGSEIVLRDALKRLDLKVLANRIIYTGLPISRVDLGASTSIEHRLNEARKVKVHSICSLATCRSKDDSTDD